jgi:hypothetical protein
VKLRVRRNPGSTGVRFDNIGTAAYLAPGL